MGRALAEFLVLPLWAAVFALVWSLIAVMITAVFVGPFALLRYWRAAGLAALVLGMGFVALWIIEVITWIGEDTFLGRRHVLIVTAPFLAFWPLLTARLIRTRARQSLPSP